MSWEIVLENFHQYTNWIISLLTYEANALLRALVLGQLYKGIIVIVIIITIIIIFIIIRMELK